jgi:large subunit ribosomal protein L24
MHIKKGDNVIVLAGSDKGKSGKVLRAFPRLNKVLVEGVNTKKVHEKKKTKDGKGQIVERDYPIHASNVVLRK